jgi:hypothetical protein
VRNNETYFAGVQFLRPNETFHTPTHKFLRQEVFLTQTLEHIAMSKIQGHCYVVHAKDYFKYRPCRIDKSIAAGDFADEDIYVCESRYNMKSKIFKKIKSWTMPDNERVQLIARETVLDNTRYPSTLVHHHVNNDNNNDFVHRSSTTDSESMPIDIIEQTRRTVPYDSVINDKFNENLATKRVFYEQVVLTSNQFYKVGDYVYVNNIEQTNGLSSRRYIVRIEKIWQDHE